MLSLGSRDFAEASPDYYRAKVLRQKTRFKGGQQIVKIPGDALCPGIEWRWNRKTRELIINRDGGDLDGGFPPTSETLRLDEDGWRRIVAFHDASETPETPR